MGRTAGVSPIIERRAGLTNTSNDTYADTGLPGNVNTGTPRCPSRPNPWGLPGCIATWWNATPSGPDSTCLTTSYAPMLTPPEVTTTSTCSTNRSSRERTVCESSPTQERYAAVAPARATAPASR